MFAVTCLGTDGGPPLAGVLNRVSPELRNRLVKEFFLTVPVAPKSAGKPGLPDGCNRFLMKGGSEGEVVKALVQAAHGRMRKGTQDKNCFSMKSTVLVESSSRCGFA